jgi:hypothetical protein
MQGDRHLVDQGRGGVREIEHRDIFGMDRSIDNSDSSYLKVAIVQEELEKHNKELQEKFRKCKEEIDALPTKPEAFKAHQLPLARIKKIMKSDEDVKVASFKPDDLCRSSNTLCKGL